MQDLYYNSFFLTLKNIINFITVAFCIKKLLYLLFIIKILKII